MRLSSETLSRLPEAVARPGYDRSAQAAGVMLGPLSRYAVQSPRRGWLFGYAGYGDEEICAAARVVGALARRASKA